MDYDTYSANDAIGKVYLDLNPLLMPPALLGRGNVWAESVAVPPSGKRYFLKMVDPYFRDSSFQVELFCLDGSLFLTQCMG